MRRRKFPNSSFLILTFVCISLSLSAVWLNAAAIPAPTSQPDQASAIAKIVQDAMKTEHLRAVIIKVTQDDKVITSQAFGESMSGVPATTAMHFRNGAVAFAYLGTLLMEFVDEHKVTLDDTIDRWMPTLPEANKVTLKMLANQNRAIPTSRPIRRGSLPGARIHSTSGLSESGSSTRSPAPCSSLRGRTGATRTPTS